MNTMNKEAIKLIDIRLRLDALDAVKSLYMASFPPEERREWSDIEEKILKGDDCYAIYVINCNQSFSGFISRWKFDDFIYVEHFAVDERQRGRGVGTLALAEFIAKADSDVVLEVELATTSEMARRRIAFYERCGFKACYDFEYIQPPYAPHLPSVQLLLMHYAQGGEDKNLDIVKTATDIHRYVYKKS